MRILRFLLNVIVFIIAMAVLAEYFQLINLHPKFPSSEKQEIGKEYNGESDNITVIEDIPSIELDEISVKDVQEENEQKGDGMYENMPNDIAAEVADVPEENITDDEDSERNVDGVNTIEVKVKKNNLFKNIPSYAKEDVLTFGLIFNGIVSYFNVFGVYLLPEEAFVFEVVGGEKSSQIKVVTTKGNLTKKDNHSWKWTAPKASGLYTIVLTPVGSSQTMKINCWVMTPMPLGKEDLVIKDFKIGNYPSPQKEEHAAPKGFIEVNKTNEKAYVSPNFQLSEFLSNQEGKWKYPNYVYLDEQLLIKLELLLAAVNDAGLKCDKFAVLSGYRTPYYNQLKDNETYSRHQFGRAVDIYIDNDNDGWMDDLNRDGKRSSEDAKVLYDLIDSFQKQSWYKPFIGGMGFYEQNSSRTSFVHIDVRTQKIPIRW